MRSASNVQSHTTPRAADFLALKTTRCLPSAGTLPYMEANTRFRCGAVFIGASGIPSGPFLKKPPRRKYLLVGSLTSTQVLLSLMIVGIRQDQRAMGLLAAVLVVVRSLSCSGAVRIAGSDATAPSALVAVAVASSAATEVAGTRPRTRLKAVPATTARMDTPTSR